MSVLKTAVLRQIAYARSVRSVIRDIMRRMLDGEWVNRIFASSDEEFNNRLDLALKSLVLKTATKRDFCEAVVGVLCDEVSELCQALKEVCEGSGYNAYFESHISHERFVRLVLSVDTVKLGKMKKILDNARLSPIDILRNIGAVLNDESLEERAALGAAEKRRANAELKAIAADVKKTMQTGLKEVNDNIKTGVATIVEKVDAVAKKVTKQKRPAKRVPRNAYDERKIAAVKSVWALASNSDEARRSLNTRMTYRTALRYGKAMLEEAGITTCEEFSKIKRAIICRESRARIKELEARRKSAAKANTERGKNGIIHPVTGRNAGAR